jgi:hypothetical protein
VEVPSPFSSAQARRIGDRCRSLGRGLLAFRDASALQACALLAAERSGALLSAIRIHGKGIGVLRVDSSPSRVRSSRRSSPERSARW